MILAAGRLKHRITISRGTRTPTGKGGFTTTWAPVATVWAEVISLNGREAVIANALQGVSSYRITVRWKAGLVTEKDQIVYDGKTLNVRSAVDPDGSRVAWSILADSEAVQG